MGELGALFNPGMRHELEERQAKAARREEEGNARDGDLRIDLESGVAVINVPGDDDAGRRASRSSAEPQRLGPPTGGTDRPTGRHAADCRPDDGQQAETQPTKPPRLRPRGKRGMSTANR